MLQTLYRFRLPVINLQLFAIRKIACHLYVLKKIYNIFHITTELLQRVLYILYNTWTGQKPYAITQKDTSVRQLSCVFRTNNSFCKMDPFISLHVKQYTSFKLLWEPEIILNRIQNFNNSSNKTIKEEWNTEHISLSG